MLKKKIALAAVAGLAVVALSACSDQATQNDQQTAQAQLGQFQATQPVPSFQWSQERQSLIAIEEARANTVATTTFFYNMGSSTPVGSCPSVGFPIASTSELTNPEQISTNSAVISQIDPTGIYTGASSGTYVVCVDPHGVKYVNYWEGDVYAVGGTASLVNGQVVLQGAPTVVVKEKK